MLTIRLSRIGKKNKPYFRIVLQEHTIAPGGRHVDVLGSYDPHMKKVVLKEEKIKYWIGKGAQASDTVHNLFVKNGILEGEKRKVKLPAKKVAEVKEEEKKEEAPSETEPKEEKTPEVTAEEVKTEAEEANSPAGEEEAPKAE